MFREKCIVLENKKVAPGHFVLKMRSPRISKNAKPGQFVQVLCADSFDPLLPRPFSFLTASADDFSLLYQVVGKGTHLLAQAKRGDALWILGPLGNGFTTNVSLRGGRRPTKQSLREHRLLRPFGARNDIVLVGGGVGIPPLYHLARHLILSSPQKRGSKSDSRLRGNDIHVFLGARNKFLLLCEKDFKKLGVDLHVATDDGSKGHKGFVTEILDDFLHHSRLTTQDSRQIYTCGPTPMLKAVSAISQKYEAPCEVSVEVPMACGFGACLGCAIKVRGETANEHRFAIACCEGPVFQGKEILWD